MTARIRPDLPTAAIPKIEWTMHLPVASLGNTNGGVLPAFGVGNLRYAGHAFTKPACNSSLF